MAYTKKQVQEQETQAVSIAVMKSDVSYVRKAVDDLTTKIDHNYVTKEEFTLVKNLVYGFVGLVLVAVVGAILSYVVRRQS